MTQQIISLGFFMFGAIIASFIGVIVARLNTGEGFLTGRSRCDVCGEELSAGVLIPILSYISSRGRSRCCGARFSWQSPVSEALLGTLFVVMYELLGLSVALPLMLLTLTLLLLLVLYDLTHQILPPVPLWLFVISAALAGYATAPKSFLSTLAMAGVLALVLLAMHIFSRGRAMGFADAPFVFGLALMTGSTAAFPGFVFSFWIGAIVGIIVLARRPRGSRMGIEVPFAPFLAAGFLLAYITQWNPFPLTLIIAAIHY